MSDTEQELDVRIIPPPQKHPTIFKTFENLEKDEAFILVNDHDPKPLRYQMSAMLGDEVFDWEYLEEGPEVWKVRIGKTA
ncbi:MAG TPA: hemerythrin [Balneolaceae bacterium]|nr:hemerythrin [Balneolaceae bacterium]